MWLMWAYTSANRTTDATSYGFSYAIANGITN
jgi:hypothetical protein